MGLLSEWFFVGVLGKPLVAAENASGWCLSGLSVLSIPVAVTMAPLSSLKYRPEENSESGFGIRRV